MQQAAQLGRAAQPRQGIHAAGVAKAQGLAQQLQRRAVRQSRRRAARFAGAQLLAHRCRQLVARVQRGHHRPAAGGRGHVHRPPAMRIGNARIKLQREQLLDQADLDAFGRAGQPQAVQAAAIDRVQIRAVRQQCLYRLAARLSAGLQERGAPGVVACFQVRSGIHQHLDQLQMSGRSGQMQRTAPAAVTRIHPRLVLEQQLHPGRVIILTGRGSDQRRHRVLQVGLGAAFEQEARQPPVAGLAGNGQRAVALVVEHVQLGGGIAQQRGNPGIGGTRGKMQRGVALGIGNAHIRAIGQQGHHRFRTAVPAVAGGGQQRSHAAMRLVQIDPGSNQCAQQTQVRQHRGQHRQLTLITAIGRRQRVGIGTGGQQLQRPVHPAGARGLVQLDAQLARHHRLQRCRRQRRFGKQFFGQWRWRSSRRCHRRAHPDALHQPVQQRCQRGTGNRQAPSPRRGQDGRPQRQQYQHAQQQQADAHAQPAPAVPGQAVEQATACRQRPALGFQGLPQRPAAPQQQGHRRQRNAEQQGRTEAAATQQRTQRQVSQHAEQGRPRQPHAQQ